MSPKSLVVVVVLTASLTITGSALADAKQVFEQWDKNGDGLLTRDEVPPGPREIFDRKDTDGNGEVTLEEHLGRMAGREKPEKPEGPSPRSDSPTNFETITIRQAWHQEPNGFDRVAYLRPPTEETKSPPVLIIFHGNGGQAEGFLRGWSRDLPDHILVAPQGYERSWNIHGEKSEADDVEYFRKLVAAIAETHPEADMDRVSLVGSSNGGGIIYRFLIEIEEPLFSKAVPQVSSMLELQYHDEKFWTQPEGSTDYSEEVVPKLRPQILYFHGTEDGTVPFDGGMRMGELHLSAKETAYAWAKHYGYGEAMITEGKDLGGDLTLYDYSDASVRLVAVEGGGHGLQPHRQAAKELAIDFITGGNQ